MLSLMLLMLMLLMLAATRVTPLLCFDADAARPLSFIADAAADTLLLLMRHVDAIISSDIR